MPPLVSRACEVVAEIGSAHGGDLDRAARLIAEIAAAGADAVKTQIIIADEITHPAATAQIDGVTVRIHQRFRELERPLRFYQQLKRYCDQQHIEFFASVFGVKSLQYAVDLGCTRIKIASPELNHLPLLAHVAATELPVVLSSGVSRLADIEDALEVFTHRERVTLLHCVTSYPADPSDYHLQLLPHYAALFSVAVGVSDHSVDPLVVPLAAVAQGGGMIEKHVQLPDAHDHLDAAVAITPAELADLTRAVAELAAAPLPARAPLIRERYAARCSLRQIAAATNGTGRESGMAAAERPLYLTTNRSIRARRNIVRGELLDAENCAILRGESLGGGLHPRFWHVVIGARAQCAIVAGAGVELSALIPAP